MFSLVSKVHLTFNIPTKGYKVPGNQGTHDKLNQIRNFNMQERHQLIIFFTKSIPDHRWRDLALWIVVADLCKPANSRSPCGATTTKLFYSPLKVVMSPWLIPYFSLIFLILRNFTNRIEKIKGERADLTFI